MRRLHSWKSAVYTLAGALAIAAFIIVVFYCKIHGFRRAVCFLRRTASYDSQLEFVAPSLSAYFLLRIHMGGLQAGFAKETAGQKIAPPRQILGRNEIAPEDSISYDSRRGTICWSPFCI